MKKVVDRILGLTYISLMTKETVTMTIRLEKALHKKYKMYAVENDVTFKEIFVEEMERRIKEAQKAKEKSSK